MMQGEEKGNRERRKEKKEGWLVQEEAKRYRKGEENLSEVGSPNLGIFSTQLLEVSSSRPQCLSSRAGGRVTRSLLHRLCSTSLMPPCWL